MPIHYIRETTLPLEEVLPYVLVGKPVGRDIYRIYAGKAVRMDSLRYQTFVVSGIRCVACDLEGQFFALERHANNNPRPERFHLNLYATKDGVEILFTKDHIKARSIGGKDHLDNFQTMCSPCNGFKGSHPVADPVLVLKQKNRRIGALIDGVAGKLRHIKAEGKTLWDPEYPNSGGLAYIQYHLRWDKKKKILRNQLRRLDAILVALSKQKRS